MVQEACDTACICSPFKMAALLCVRFLILALHTAKSWNVVMVKQAGRLCALQAKQALSTCAAGMKHGRQCAGDLQDAC